MKKVPLILVTGFLGSGKTSFLDHFLTLYSSSKRIAVVQNEFAQCNIDSEILKAHNQKFVLREINKGSIFCLCQFGNFKDVLTELYDSEDFDIVLVEATGIADPIGIAQVFDDERVSQRYYLQKIVTLVDASRFLNVLEHITSVRCQIEVADYVLINKTDLLPSASVRPIEEKIYQINPLAKIIYSEYGAFKAEDLLTNDADKPVASSIHGALTRCGDGNYVSKILRINTIVQTERIHHFLESLDKDILRLKGYVTDEKGKCYMVQYVPGQCQLIPCDTRLCKTELISIGYKEPDFIKLFQ